MTGTRRALLIVNPAASAVSAALVDRVRAELERAGPVEVLETERAGHATELAAVAGDADALYVFSGDGGYNEVVNGIAADVPVGFIPGGKTSVLPRALGLPRDPVVCARAIAAGKRVRTISLGRATFSRSAGEEAVSRRFTFAAGIGLDAEIVRAVDRRGRKRGERPSDLAFLAEVTKALVHRRGKLEPVLSVEGYGRCALAVVTNCDPYTYAGPFAIRATPQASFELGLDLAAPARLSPASLARLVWWLFVKQTPRGLEGLLSLHDLDRVAITCDRSTAAELDGEDIGDITEVVFEAERGALRVLV